MVEQSIPALLFFRGGQRAHPCTAHKVTQINARIHANDLSLLPVVFYVTFDGFRTVGRCRLAWRYRCLFEVAFESWFRCSRELDSSTEHGIGTTDRVPAFAFPHDDPAIRGEDSLGPSMERRRCASRGPAMPTEILVNPRRDFTVIAGGKD
jgi:hypothetical protein